MAVQAVDILCGTEPIIGSPVFTRDSRDRITKMVITRETEKITYDVTWVGDTSEVNTFTQTIEAL